MSSPERHDAVLARFVEVCSSDPRIVAAFLEGSIVTGKADAYSDIDLCLIAEDDAYDAVLAERASIIRKLGDPLFLENFGNEAITFFILPDGTEGELSFGRESRLDEVIHGPYRALLDTKGILEGAEAGSPEPDRTTQAEELRRILYWFWHDLSHFTAALGRGHLWWAAGQLEALRRYCINLVRIEGGVNAQDEPYEKLDRAISTTELNALRSTFPPIEHGPMLQAGLDLLTFYRKRAPRVARGHGLTYPSQLERLMSGRLEELARPPR
jgi:predicted nucleotidyltransferase